MQQMSRVISSRRADHGNRSLGSMTLLLLLAAAFLCQVSAVTGKAPEQNPEKSVDSALSRDEADQALALAWSAVKRDQEPERAREWEEGEVTAGGRTMRFATKTFGEPPADGRSLWISLHGGGGTTREMNDGQWRNQLRLYEPDEGIYLVPRAPTDTWNLWHQEHIDALFARLIDSAVVVHGVNPDRVYLLGYSAGGDGVYQMAPRMADRWAAAAMMAGHPNDASPLSLRNLPFAIFMGDEDSAYDRNRIAAEWGQKLEDLRSSDPEGYPHKVRIYEGLGHWMEGRDKEALPWMTGFTRDPWPTRVVWRQSSVPSDRFYWLSLPEDTAARGQYVTASVENSTITLETRNVPRIALRLSDQLLNLDQPFEVIHNGEQIFHGKADRTAHAILLSLEERLDPRSAATALLELDLENR